MLTLQGPVVPQRTVRVDNGRSWSASCVARHVERSSLENKLNGSMAFNSLRHTHTQRRGEEL